MAAFGRADYPLASPRGRNRADPELAADARRRVLRTDALSSKRGRRPHPRHARRQLAPVAVGRLPHVSRGKLVLARRVARRCTQLSRLGHHVRSVALKAQGLAASVLALALLPGRHAPEKPDPPAPGPPPAGPSAPAGPPAP